MALRFVAFSPVRGGRSRHPDQVTTRSTSEATKFLCKCRLKIALQKRQCMAGSAIASARAAARFPSKCRASRAGQRAPHYPMPNHKWDNSLSLLLSECQELCRKIEQSVALERNVVRQPNAVENREQQKWVFRRLSARLSLLDKQTRFLRCGFSLQ